jgi:hypothetical protein
MMEYEEYQSYLFSDIDGAADADGIGAGSGGFSYKS